MGTSNDIEKKEASISRKSIKQRVKEILISAVAIFVFLALSLVGIYAMFFQPSDGTSSNKRKDAKLTKQEEYCGVEREKISSLEEELENTKQKLDEANQAIVDAQSSAWSSYEEMGDALDNLQEVY